MGNDPLPNNLKRKKDENAMEIDAKKINNQQTVVLLI